ncbi:MAG: hypothetical protein MRJ93_14080 [Nitrososphaeraceae archaeon]|nr:hypothetical protein [Nitrososphaeraceae archaeon]
MISKLQIYIKFVIIILTSIVAITSGTHYVYGQTQLSNSSEISLPNFEIPSDYNSSFNELMSEQNFTNFSEFDNLTDFAMPNLFFQDVSGTYIDSDIGYQIDLPKDWKGKESKFMMNMVFASPKEMNLEDFEQPGTSIILFGLDKEYFEMLTNLTQISNFEEGSNDELAVGGIEEDDEQFFQDSGSLTNNNPTSESIMDSCKDFQTEPITINGISAEQIIADCIDENGLYTKVKIYAFATTEDSLILTGLYSNSNNEYNQYLPLFEESVKTIKITNPGDIAKSESYKKYKEIELQSNNTLS